VTFRAGSDGDRSRSVVSRGGRCTIAFEHRCGFVYGADSHHNLTAQNGHGLACQVNAVTRESHTQHPATR
jgi:hypothetical protein